MPTFVHLSGELTCSLPCHPAVRQHHESRNGVMPVLLVAGFLVPIPLLILHIIQALIQAYIFGMLALIYIAGAIHSQESRKPQAQE